MPEEQKLPGFSLDFSTNARQVADDIRELDKAQQEVNANSSKVQKGSDKQAKKSVAFREELLSVLREMRDLQQKIANTEKKINQERETADENIIDANKTKIEQNKTMLGQFARFAVIGRAVLQFSNSVQRNFKDIASYEYLAISTLSPGVTPGKVAGLRKAGQRYGATDSSAAANLGRIQNILNSRRLFGQLGFDPALASRFPGLSEVFLDSTGSIQKDPIEVLNRLNRFVQPYSAADRAAMVSGLGLTADLGKLISLSPSAYSTEMQQGMAAGEMLAKNAAESARSDALIQGIKDDIAAWKNQWFALLPDWMKKSLPVLEEIMSVGKALLGYFGIKYLVNVVGGGGAAAAGGAAAKAATAKAAARETTRRGFGAVFSLKSLGIIGATLTPTTMGDAEIKRGETIDGVWYAPGKKPKWKIAPEHLRIEKLPHLPGIFDPDYIQNLKNSTPAPGNPLTRDASLNFAPVINVNVDASGAAGAPGLQDAADTIAAAVDSRLRDSWQEIDREFATPYRA